MPAFRSRYAHPAFLVSGLASLTRLAWPPVSLRSPGMEALSSGLERTTGNSLVRAWTPETDQCRGRVGRTLNR